jgi:PAS domain S-box-containing protein
MSIQSRLIKKIREQKQKTLSLRQNEEYFRPIMENMSEGIMLFDAKGNLFYQNTASLKIHGFSEEEQKISQNKLAGTWDAWDENGRHIKFEEWPVSRVFRGERFKDQILHVRRIETGQEFDASYNGSPILDSAGNIEFGFITIRDITKHVQVLRELRQSEERFRAAQALSPDGFTILHPIRNEQGKIIDFEWIYENKTIARLNWTDPSKIIGKRLLETISGHQNSPFYRAYLKVAESREPLVIEAPFESEKEKEEKWFRVVVVPAGEDIAVLAQDITERKTAAEAKSRLAAIVETSEDAIISKNLLGMIMTWNKGAERLFGYKAEEVIGKNINILLPAERFFEEAKILALIRQGKTVEHLETVRVTKDGKRLQVFITSSPIKSVDGRIIGASKIIRDITALKQSEEKLRLSEEKFSKAFTNNPAAIAITRLEDGLVVDMNETWARLTGYSKEELIGHSARLIWPSTEEADNFVAELKEKGRINDREHKFRTKSGGVFVASFSTQVLDISGEKVILSALIDISERKRAEESLKKYELLSEGTRDIVLFIEIGGRIIEANAAAVKAYGYSREELLSLKIYDLRTTEPAADVMAQMNVADVSGIIFETKHKRKDGSLFDVEVSSHGADIGQQRVLMSLVRDITKRKQAEKALRESEEKFRVVFEQAAIGMGRVDLTSARWIGVNQTFCRMLGYTSEEMLVTSWPEMTHPDDIELDLIPFKEMAAGKLDNYSVEKRFIHKDGHYVWVRLTLSLARDVTGKPDYEIAIIEDVSERKQTEQKLHKTLSELDRSNKELESFSYAAAHDLQEPLRSVASFVYLLEKKNQNKLDEASKDYLSTIKKAVKRMQLLITNLLSYAKIGKENLKFEAIDLNTIMNDVRENLTAKIETEKAVVRYGGLPVITADKVMITQLFQNLLNNAIKFHKPDIPPEIVVSAEELKKQWKITVRDNGIGIEEKYFDKIFVIFSRLHARDKYEGAGVGLSSVKKIVDLHGGNIEVESKVNEGTAFHVTIPKKQP